MQRGDLEAERTGGLWRLELFFTREGPGAMLTVVMAWEEVCDQCQRPREEGGARSEERGGRLHIACVADVSHVTERQAQLKKHWTN
jgi:hypothetical protein